MMCSTGPEYYSSLQIEKCACMMTWFLSLSIRVYQIVISQDIHQRLSATIVRLLHVTRQDHRKPSRMLLKDLEFKRLSLPRLPYLSFEDPAAIVSKRRHTGLVPKPFLRRDTIQPSYSAIYR
ncbi:uncharacterized protein ARMOST_15434 [Armillaria ostoyae]|uniref:Uncharacterized protein n=1 Tax=Armillaria ostoyae TaxID=47428 RepID=A0A284RTC4_ARMOS|nr:uncharacterized protein ARMOST_15434 [Armillaria ostoyae]